MTTYLCELGAKYFVDKCPSIYHDYTPTYDSILGPLRHDIKTILEIGIGHNGLMKPICGENYKHGASLRMWRDYFPNARITSCDILEEVLFNDEERIETYLADQSNIESLESLVSKIKPNNGFFDFIIDDGSHIELHQTISFTTLWKYVRPNGGIYIIEDIWIGNDLDKMAELHKRHNIDDAELVGKYDGTKDNQGFVIFRKK